MKDLDRFAVAQAIALLRVLGRMGAVIATGSFDYCDPCENFIAFPKRVRPLMRASLRDYYRSADHDETWTAFQSKFAWNECKLSTIDEEELRDLAESIVGDHRYEEIEELFVDKNGSITVPLP